MISMNTADGNGGQINSPETTPSLNNPEIMPKWFIASGQANSQEEIVDSPLLLLMGAIRRKWRIGLPLGMVLGAAMGVLGWKVFPAKYSASSYLRVNADETPLIFETADQAATRASTFGLYKATQSQLLKTPFVINAALRDETELLVPELRGQVSPTHWLQKNLNVTFPGNGEILQVSFESISAEGCVTLLNAIVDAYMNEVVMSARNARLKRLDNLERAHSEAENKIRSKRVELKKLADALGTSDSESLTLAQQTAIQRFGAVQEKLSEVQINLLRLESEWETAEIFEEQWNKQQLEQQGRNTAQNYTAQNLDDPITIDLAKPADLLKLEAEVSDLTLKIAILNVGPRHPSHRRLTMELENARSILENQTKQWESRKNFVPGQEDPQQLKLRIRALKKQESQLVEKVNELQEETRKLGKSSIDVELMRSEIEGHEEVLARVGGEIEKTSIELKTDTRVQLISAAESPIPPSPLKRIGRVLLLAGLGFGSPMFFLVLWDLRAQKLGNFEVVSKKLSLLPLGTVPLVHENPISLTVDNEKIQNSRHASVLHESVDGIALMLMHRALLEDRNVIMFSSAVASEGKSTISSQVAISLARSGKTVALVDFDLRRPSIHEYLNLNVGPGVREILGEAQDWVSAVQYVKNVGDLSVIAVGEADTHLVERAGCGALEDFVDRLRDNFDFVILDSSPIVPVVDTRIIAKFTDGVVLTMRRDVSTLPLVTAASDILQAHGVSLIGSVIIGPGNNGGYSGHADYYRTRLGENRVEPSLRRGIAEVN